MRQRTTQHRSRREEAIARELADTKRDNHYLRRQVARLNRELEKRTVAASEPTSELRLKMKKEVKVCCAKMDIRKVIIPGGTLIVCRSCLERKVVKS